MAEQNSGKVEECAMYFAGTYIVKAKRSSIPLPTAFMKEIRKQEKHMRSTVSLHLLSGDAYGTWRVVPGQAYQEKALGCASHSRMGLLCFDELPSLRDSIKDGHRYVVIGYGDHFTLRSFCGSMIEGEYLAQMDQERRLHIPAEYVCAMRRQEDHRGNVNFYMDEKLRMYSDAALFNSALTHRLNGCNTGDEMIVQAEQLHIDRCGRVRLSEALCKKADVTPLDYLLLRGAGDHVTITKISTLSELSGGVKESLARLGYSGFTDADDIGDA